MVAGRELRSARDRARQEAEAERRAGDETGVPAAHLFEQAAGYGANIHHVEIGLDDRHVAGPQRLQGVSRSLGRGAPGSDLAAGRQARQRLAHVGGQQHVERGIVQQEQVEIVRAQATKASLRRRNDRRRREVRRSVPRLVAGLGRQHRLVADAGQCLADQFLAVAVAVGRRRVEEGDAAVMRPGERRQGGAIVGVAVGGLADGAPADPPRAEADLRNDEPGPTEATVVHG